MISRWLRGYIESWQWSRQAYKDPAWRRQVADTADDGWAPDISRLR